MNILLASSKYMPEYSGSGFRAHNLYKRLTEKTSNVNLTILCGSTTDNDCCEYEYDGFKIKRIAQKKYANLSKNKLIRRIQIVRNFISEHHLTVPFLQSLPAKPDLIHVFGKSYVNASVLDFAGKNNIPALIELCNEMNTPLQFVPFPLKYSVSTDLPGKYHIICISEHLKKMCINNGISEDKIWCRPNPVDEKRFFPVDKGKKDELRKKLSKFSKDDILVVYIAKYRPSKNHLFLLDVIDKLPPNYKLFMKGPLVENGPQADRDRELFNKIIKQIEERNLHPRVEVAAGFCENIEDYYRMADVYAFPSIEEGLGTPVLENIASGIPVVANIIPGATDLWIKNGENGFLCNLDDNNFAGKIVASVAFSEEQRNSESEKIIDIAGTKSIDAHYINLIEKMVKSD